MSRVQIVLFSKNGWDRGAQGVAGAGRRLADGLGAELHAVVLGPADDALKNGLAAAAQKVQVVSALEEYQPEPALAAAASLCDGAAAVLFGNDTYSQEIVPRLAHRLGGAPMADAQKLEVKDGRIHVTRSAYGGKALSEYVMKATPAVIWVRSRALEPAEGDVGGAVEEATVELPEAKLRITERHEEAQEGASLEEAEIIVSGGRGLGGPEPFEQMLAPLADVMHAVQGASRAACDAGWVPPNWQVGQTGKKVAPELYLAIAISGASQHLLGMGDSKVVAAINTDADAPIFKHCSFGIVEDYKNVVPLLTEKLKEMQS
ncbi:MAG: electron transfer flavoprotein subunit alpha/FixB family protein [Acidobacteria bacterium]|nr:MAG: electron transfer flavoprotein subunit alpha/FixB family protein [Acidobacteriota bacterium]REK01095.1 MAG: electron transfer flavoprotein subunit alpha/FixB family protein [Acidobacteriota bacterium]